MPFLLIRLVQQQLETEDGSDSLKVDPKKIEKIVCFAVL